MSGANLIVLPAVYGMPPAAVDAAMPFIAVFNVAQGALTVLLGMFLYEAYKKRVGKGLSILPHPAEVTTEASFHEGAGTRV